MQRVQPFSTTPHPPYYHHKTPHNLIPLGINLSRSLPLEPMANLLQSPLYLALILLLLLLFAPARGEFPPTCERIECPSYGVVDAGNGFEIRRYNSTSWMSTEAIEDVSFVAATRAGFLQ